MAKQVLPTNFVDDILAPSMGGKRRFNLIQNDDGTYSLEDATDYTQTGSDFGAGQINATNQAVNESCDKADVIDDLEDVVANQANGKIAGAKSVATLNAYLAELISNLMSDPVDIQNSQLTNAVNIYDGSCYQVIGNRMFFIFNVDTTVQMTSGMYYEIFNMANTPYRNNKIRYIGVSDDLRVDANYNRIRIVPLGGNLQAGTGLYFEFSIPIQKVIE